MAAFAICLISVWLSGSPARADDDTRPEVTLEGPLTADECVRLALERNYGIRQAADLKGIEDSNKLRAWGGFVPSVNLGYDYVHSNSLSESRPTSVFQAPFRNIDDQNGWSIIASQTLLSLPVIYNIISAGRNSGAAEAEVRSAELTAARIVRQQYYNVIESIKLDEVAREDVRLAGEELRRTQSLFEVGSVARTDVLKSNVRVSEAQSTLTAATNRIEIERARLNQALALPPDVTVQVIESLEPRDGNPDSVTAFTAALAERPDLRAARKRLSAARADQKAALGGKIPFLSHSFRKGNTDSRGDGRIFNNEFGIDTTFVRTNTKSWSYQIGVSWNILDGLVTESNMQRAKYNKLLQEHQLLELENTALVETKEALVAIRNARAQILVAREGRTSAEEDLNLSQERYSVGLGTILELIDAQVNVSRARTGEVTAMAALKRAEAQLDEAVGRINW